ncbi:MAG TPA: hypothetical protein VLA49_16620 [Anaerolineales bacterium]|nr:hypothetical protein [Anaerolineales bacterium]
MDLNIFPLARQNDQILHELAGLHAAIPPRRPARGRAPDRLILHFSLEGSALVSSEQTKQILESLAQTYYKTPGSVTAAMRTVAEKLNQQLLDRNLREAGSGRQFVGTLSMLVLREDRAYISQSGPVHAFLISKNEVQHIHDPALARRGLGIGRTAPIYYSQVALDVDNILLLSAQAPASWSEGALQGLAAQGADNLHQRIMAISGSNLEAVLIQVRSGPGKVYQLKPKPGTAAVLGTATRDETISQPKAEEAPAIRISEQAEVEPETSQASSPLAGQIQEAELQPEPAQVQEPAPATQRRFAPSPASLSAAEVETTTTPAEVRPIPKANPVSRALARIGAATLATLGSISTGLRSLFRRMLPDESILAIPGPVMALIAVAIPLVVVSVATVVYFRRGRAAQYEIYYAQAVQAAGYAQGQTDPQARIEAWQSVITYLDQAEIYQQSQDSQILRQNAQRVFDELDLTTRLDFQPAIADGLPEEASIAHITATETELYLLNATTGNVLRAFAVARGYELDPTYQCGPGLPGSQEIGPLVDIHLLSKNSAGEATLLGMDANGYTLQCQPGKPPTFTAMAPPATGWGKPLAFTLSLDGTYVLDPQANAVWIYWNNDFSQQPQLYFAEEVPPMADVIDLAVNKNDLFLLHTDGHISQCAFSELEVAPTRCTDPLPYTDSRPGREGQAFASLPAFSQILATQPPDPSLLILEPERQAIYLFSLRLTFQRQYRPAIQAGSSAAPLPAATAFGTTPDKRVAFMAFGNLLSYAGMP